MTQKRTMICDRCQTGFWQIPERIREEHIEGLQYTIRKPGQTKDFNANLHKSGEKDLCPDCTTDFHHFWNNVVTDGEPGQ